jgi:large subunit ribosomal protein L10e
MPLRPARCYTHFSGPPYTRKEYIPGIPQPKITKFEMGNPKGEYQYVVKIVAEEGGQIRHNALESARVMINKRMSVVAGDLNYYLRVKKYPHHVIRENKMMAFAGADRLQDGMRLSFGKPIGLAARVAPGDVIIELFVRKEHLEEAKKSMKVAASKLPLPSRIVIEPVESRPGQ